MRIRSFLVLSFPLFSPVYAQVVDLPPSVKAVRIHTPPRIDGRLDDPVWQLAEPATGFRQREPLDGAPATEQTEIRVLFDDEAFYFGCTFFDSEPEKIVARLARRDDEEETDCGSIRIDPFHDHQTAFEFTFNPAGVKVDIIQFDDGEWEDASWDPVWDLETQITPEGWTAEVKIPFSILRYPTAGKDSVGRSWGINFTRIIQRKQENTWWAYSPRTVNGSVSRYGHLLGLDSLPRPRRLEVMPFGLARQEWIPATETHDRISHLSADGGLDLKLGFSNSFILDATVNPDFGQVEADPAVLNLSTIETFYPEKRPFFTEGAQILKFSTMGDEGGGPGLFYSRRIGRALGEDEVDLEENEKTTDVPMSTTILGAVKLTGKTAGGLSLGVLEAVTPEEHATIDSAGTSSRTLLEPRASYSVVRLRQDVLDGSTIGMIATAVLKETRLPAFTGGIDWILRLADRSYQFDGFVAGSQTSNQAGKRISGAAGRMSFSRTSNPNWLWSLSGDFTTKQYNVNDIGYFRRPNDFGVVGTLEFHEYTPASAVRTYEVQLMAHERENFDGANLFRDLGLEADVGFVNYWGASASITADFGSYDDRETRGNGLYGKPSRAEANLSLRSDNRQDAIVDLGLTFATDENGARSSSTSIGLTLRPTHWMQWYLEGMYKAVNAQEAWIENREISGETASIFGDRTTREFSTILRGDVTFTRNLTLQLYAQIFTAKGHYEDFRQLTDPLSFEPFPFDGNPDFNEQAFNLNLVFRWEYAPGSTAYIVWSQARAGETSEYFTSIGDDIQQVFRTPPSNVMMVKVSLWWSL